MNRRLAAAGFLPLSREDRLYALDHLGLPQTFQPSRASTLRLAQNLDADYVVVGSFQTEGTTLKATAQILDVSALRLSAPLDEQAEPVHLLALDNTLAWRVARELDSSYSVAEQTFVAADADLRLDAFENYVRGLVEGQPEERIRHLKEAVRLAPEFPPAWLALGKAYFANQQFEAAAASLGHLPTDDPNALGADFYRGLSYFYTGSYAKAEDAFAFVVTRLPLPEVVNNQAVAASRRGKDATPLFEQAAAADPKDADYHFNLAISLRRRNDIAGATREIDQAIKLHPQDTEAQALAATLASATKTPVSFTPGGSSGEPLERIKRTYNEASFQQAAFEFEQVQALRLTNLRAQDRAIALTKDGLQFLNRGLMLEAERQFHSALQADPSCADAHAGLAQVRERSGDNDAARQEAQQSLQLKPNVAAHLVLARLDLQANHLTEAASEVSESLKLEPNNSAARGMRQALETRGQQVP
jgi:tetratricopeptide (TPR) repeat protein